MRRDVGRLLGSGRTETPRRFLLKSYAASLFRRTAERRSRRPLSSPQLVIAYSIKTNPLPDLLDLARQSGMWAEAITQCEVAHAMNRGIAPSRTVLNGPAKWWPDMIKGVAYGAVFCDSLEELRRLSAQVARKRVQTQCLGIRLRPGTVSSRFGIDLSEPEVFNEVVRLMKRLPTGQEIGFHFHIASSMIGVKTWRDLAYNFLTAVDILSAQIGPRRATISFGGGWHPDDWDGFMQRELPRLVTVCRRTLPHVHRLILEPGKALCQRTMCLLSRVLEVRRSRGRTEIVVDASIAELPDLRSHPHRMVSCKPDGRIALWERGSDRILGRLCMEFDILADTVQIPPRIKAGDLMAFLDAGAYDASMAYPFSRGFVAALPAPGSL